MITLEWAFPERWWNHHPWSSLRKDWMWRSVDVVMLGHRLDSISEDFSNLIDAVILLLGFVQTRCPALWSGLDRDLCCVPGDTYARENRAVTKAVSLYSPPNHPLMATFLPRPLIQQMVELLM